MSADRQAHELIKAALRLFCSDSSQDCIKKIMILKRWRCALVAMLFTHRKAHLTSALLGENLPRSLFSGKKSRLRNSAKLINE